MNIFTRIFDPIKEVFSKLLNYIRDPKGREAAAKLLKEINDMAPIAIQAVRIVANLTPTTLDDRLVVAATKLQVKLSDILAMTGVEREAYLRGLARELVRTDLVDKVINSAGIKIGDTTLVTREQVEDIANYALNSAIELAFATLKKGGEIQ